MNNKGADQSPICAGWSATLFFANPVTEDSFIGVDAQIDTGLCSKLANSWKIAYNTKTTSACLFHNEEVL